MRKNAAFLILSLFLLGLFACQFAIPTAVEIIGSPSARFAETVDIGKMFTDLLKEAINNDERLTIIPCEQTETMTFLIHAELLNKPFGDLRDTDELDDIFPGHELLSSDFNFPLTMPKKLILYKTVEDQDPEDRLVIPLSELGSLLEGFEFSECEVKLYISGTQIIEKSRIRITIYEIDVVDDEEQINKIKIEDEDEIDEEPENEPSAIEDWKANGYNEDFCPDGGIPIKIPLTGKDVILSFEVYIPEGETLFWSDFGAGSINVEVVVWLPFAFEAGDDGAEIAFPEDSFFSSEDDLFGREEPDSESLITDIIESLSVSVKFEKNPFQGADLIIESKGIEIHNPIENDSLSFTVTADDMKKINNPDNYPFTPNIKIRVEQGESIKFPWKFNATEFSFNAKIRYRKDFL